MGRTAGKLADKNTAFAGTSLNAEEIGQVNGGGFKLAKPGSPVYDEALGCWRPRNCMGG